MKAFVYLAIVTDLLHALVSFQVQALQVGQLCQQVHDGWVLQAVAFQVQHLCACLCVCVFVHVCVNVGNSGSTIPANEPRHAVLLSS